MSWLQDDFLYEVEKIHRSLRKAIRFGEHFLGRMQQQLPEWFQGGPKAEVYDEGKQVRVVLEAPGLTRDTGMKWAHRIVNGQLLLRGVLDVEKSVRTQGGRFYSERQSERFLKLIPLPAPIKAKPSAVRYRNGLLELTFDKRRSEKDSPWYELEI